MKKILGFVFLLLLVTSCEAKKERLELNLTKGETYTQQNGFKHVDSSND